MRWVIGCVNSALFCRRGRVHPTLGLSHSPYSTYYLVKCNLKCRGSVFILFRIPVHTVGSRGKRLMEIDSASLHCYPPKPAR